MKHLPASFNAARVVVLLLITASLAATIARATTRTWTGGGAGNNWNTTANWSPSGTPTTGDTLVFTNNWGKTTNNLPADTAFTLRLTSGGNNIYGNRIRLNGLYTYNTEPPPVHGGTNFINLDLSLNANALHENTANECLITGDVDLNTHTLTLSNYYNCNSYYSGQITNTGNIVKRGTEDVYFTGTQANTYTGTTTVREGALRLGKKIFSVKGGNYVGVTSIPGALIIGDNTGTNSYATASGAYDGGGATVILDFGNQFDAITTTILRDGWFDLNGYNDTIGSLVLSNGAVSTLTGTLTLSSNLTVAAGSTNSFIAGELSWSSATNHTLDVPTGAKFFLTAVLGGSGDWAKTGDGWLRLDGVNTFTGDLTVFGGLVDVSDPLSLGSTNGATIINSSGRLRLTSNVIVAGEPLQLDAASTLDSAGTNVWAGPITFAGGGNRSLTGNQQLTLAGPISGTGDCQLTGVGVVQFSGATANTYLGTTTVGVGPLLLNKAANITAIPGDLIIGNMGAAADTDIVKLLQPGQISGSSLVTINESGLLDLNGQDNTTGGVNLNGGHITTGAGLLILGGSVTVGTSTNRALVEGKIALGHTSRLIQVTNNGVEPDLDLRATVVSGGWMKGGPGSVFLSGTNTYTGETYLTNGLVRVDNPRGLGTAAGNTSVRGDATLLLHNVTITNEMLYLESAGATGYAGLDSLGDSSWLGLILLVGEPTIGAQAIYGTLTLGGELSFDSPGAGFTKTQLGTVILANTVANSYEGLTIVNAGTLKLKPAPGVITIPAGVQVNTNATLEGRGQIVGGALVVNGGSVSLGNYGPTGVEPAGGATGETIAALAAIFTNISSMVFDVGTTNNNNDCLVVTNLLLASTYLTVFDARGGATTPGTTFTIISNTGPAAVSGTFVLKPQGTLITNDYGPGVLQLSYTGGDGNDVTLTRVGFGAPAAQNLALTALGSGVFQFTATGQAGYLYRLQTSTNLATWSNLDQLVGGAGGSLQINRTNAPGEPQRFYRLQSL